MRHWRYHRRKSINWLFNIFRSAVQVEWWRNTVDERVVSNSQKTPISQFLLKIPLPKSRKRRLACVGWLNWLKKYSLSSRTGLYSLTILSLIGIVCCSFISNKILSLELINMLSCIFVFSIIEFWTQLLNPWSQTSSIVSKVYSFWLNVF